MKVIDRRKLNRKKKTKGKSIKKKKKKISIEQLLKRRWEKVPLRGAHIKFKNENAILNRFKVLLTDKKINVDNKTIIDYGCGGGFLGKYLLDNFKIKKYIAYDVAERSLNSAKERLEKYKDNIEFHLVVNHNINFKEKKPDIFCAFACLLHFPTEEYLINFLNNVNNCKAKTIVIEIRNENIGTVFQKKVYKDFQSLVRACITEPEYISKNLTNYELYDKTDNKKHITNCQILYFKRKGE